MELNVILQVVSTSVSGVLIPLIVLLYKQVGDLYKIIADIRERLARIEARLDMLEEKIAQARQC